MCVFGWRKESRRMEGGGRERVVKRKKEREERRKKWGGKSWELREKDGGQNGEKHKNGGKGK